MTAPVIETRPDGSATIRLDLTYAHPSGRADLTEGRELRISAPAGDGSYTIDWRSDFVGRPAGRRPRPYADAGEPDGRVNGGYAGLGVRLAAFDSALVRTTGELQGKKSDGEGPVIRGITFTQYAYRALEVEGREPAEATRTQASDEGHHPGFPRARVPGPGPPARGAGCGRRLRQRACAKR